jgi:hypothetical protein
VQQKGRSISLDVLRKSSNRPSSSLGPVLAPLCAPPESGLGSAVLPSLVFFCSFFSLLVAARFMLFRLVFWLSVCSARAELLVKDSVFAALLNA